MLSRNFVFNSLCRTFTTSSSSSSSSSTQDNNSAAAVVIDAVDRQPGQLRKHLIVIGGGFVGLSIALHLHQIGRCVTIIDASSHIRSPQSCSYGNAGTMAMYANVPVNNSFSYGSLVLPKVVAFFNPTTATTTDTNDNKNNTSSPLSFNFNVNNSTQLYHLVSNFIPWSLLFLWNCRPSAIIHTSKSLGALLSQAESGWDPIWEQCGINIDNNRIHEGYLILLRSKKNELEKLVSSSTTTTTISTTSPEVLRRQFLPNLKMKQLCSSKEVLKMEPSFNPEVCNDRAWYFEDGWCLTDPSALLKALAHGFVNNDTTTNNRGELRMGSTVVDIVEVEKNSEDENKEGEGIHVRQVRAILDDGTHVVADEIIIAAGAHSASLVSSSMGEFCPLETERGYSITFDNTNTNNTDTASSSSSLSSLSSSSSLLTRAVCDQRNGWVATPMTMGSRVAGKVELALGGGTNVTTCPPTLKIFDQLEQEAQFLFEKENNTNNTNVLGKRNKSKDWLGFRPTMPDALPVIGRSKKLPHSVYYAFGHQHIGVTLGGITGKLISELVQGKEPSVDLTPYELDRFHFLDGWWK